MSSQFWCFWPHLRLRRHPIAHQRREAASMMLSLLREKRAATRQRAADQEKFLCLIAIREVPRSSKMEW